MNTFDIIDLLSEVEMENENEERDVRIFVNGSYTTAVENGHSEDGLILIAKRYPWVNIGWLEKNKRLYGPDTIRAVVKCHEDDEYDEKVGRNEAIKKLNTKIMENREKIVNKFEEYIRQQMANPAAKKQIKKEV